MVDRRFASNFDFGFMLGVLLLLAVGAVSVYSATHGMGARSELFYRQISWMGVGLTVMFFALVFDYRHLKRWGWPIYGISVALLIAVLVIGRTGMGAQRWLPLGPVSFQPSELAKICLIIGLAKFYSEDGIIAGHTLKQLVKPLMIVGASALLIVKQPDLGTALMLIFIFCAMTVAAGIDRRSLVYMGVTSALSAPIAWKLFWGSLEGYQKKRILVFLNPDSDPTGAGYHITQSKIAVGSGALTGKGYLHGTQSQLSFLPERHTDFIFSVISEEWGFLGSIVVLMIYLYLILWGFDTAMRAKDRFGAFLAVGITSMLSFYVFINVGMVLGIMPVVGVPLPLVSYGGTSAVTMMMAFGLLMNVNMRRYYLFS
jgi:rod shape determining protein RodA